MRSLSLRLLFAVLGLALLLPFQNCTSVKSSASNPASNSDSTNHNAGNGGSYDGKPDVYRHFDQQLPCSTKDLNGGALPNEVIVIRADVNLGSGGAYLARRACADIDPVSIPSADISWASSTELVYQKKTFSAQNPARDFGLVVPACPAGRSLRTPVALNNQFGSSLNWLAAPWFVYPGIRSALYGTIASLPVYDIARNDSRYLESWRRLDQTPALATNTEYVFSFLAQPGTISAADVNVFRAMGSATTSDPRDDTALVTFDFLARSARIVYSQNLANVSATIVPFGNGYLCSVYFTTSARTAPSLNTAIGVGPSTVSGTTRLGDSIRATNAILLEVNQYCR